MKFNNFCLYYMSRGNTVFTYNFVKKISQLNQKCQFHNLSLSLSLSLSIYIYIYLFIFNFIYLSIYLFIQNLYLSDSGKIFRNSSHSYSKELLQGLSTLCNRFTIIYSSYPFRFIFYFYVINQRSCDFSL